jgi:hypothetical protein
MEDDFDPTQYVQPDGPEARKYKDGAKVVDCDNCGLSMMLPIAATRTTCLDCTLR